MNRIILFVISLVLFSPLSLEAKDRDYDQLRDSIVSYAKKYIGCKYAYAGKGPKTFDCSGFTSFVFGKFNYTLNSSSSAQATQGEKIKLNKAEKGDLIFFKGSNANSNTVGHVGMITDVSANGDTVLFIHAAVNGGVRIDYYPGYAYYNVRFIGCRRIFGEVSSNESSEQDSSSKKDETIVVEKDTIPSQVIDKLPKPVVPDTTPSNNPQEEKQPKVIEDTKKDESYTKRDSEKKKKKEKKGKIKETVITHIVKKGETLYRLSINYGCSVEEIQKWNKMNNTNLRIGQELIIKKK